MRPALFAVLAMLLAPAAQAAAAAATEAADQAAIRAALNDGCKATVAGNVAGMIAPFLKTTPDQLTMFNFDTPRSLNYAQLRQDDANFAAATKGAPDCRYLEIHPVLLAPNAAYSWAIMQAAGTLKNGAKFDFTIRSTDVWRKIGGHWLVVHEHNSFPVDMTTGKADMQSRP